MTYKEFIQNIINTRGQWNITNNNYYEAHHIVPKCLGGLPNSNNVHNSKHENIIWLYPQEHYEAHKLLALENPTNTELVFAWAAISHLWSHNKLSDIQISAEDYAKLAVLDSVQKSIRYTGSGNPNYGKVCTEAQREHFSKLYKNSVGVKTSPRFSGRHHTEATKQKLKQKLTGRFWITNNIIELLVIPGTEVPDGFKRGRLVSKDTVTRQHFFANKVLDNKSGIAKSVYCIELQKDFSSAAEASRHLNINASKISACCHGNRNTAGGYHWKFVDLTTKLVVKCIETNKIYDTIQMAANSTNINRAKICECCKGKRKTAGGYHWQYIKILLGGYDEH